MTSIGVDGLSNALLSIASDEDQIALLHHHLDRYCHRFRNRLNSMKLCLYLGKKTAGESETPQSVWRELEARYRVLESLVEQFQHFCRPFNVTPMELPMGSFLEELRRAWLHRLSEKEIDFELVPPHHPVKSYLDPSRMAQGLDALACWRGSVIPPGSSILLSWWEEEGSVYLGWEEPEPNLSAQADPTEELQANIALPILARILNAHGGTLEVSSQECFELHLRWPSLPVTSSLKNEIF